MGTDGSKQHKGPVIPPSELSVRKFTESRAPELESLYSTIASRLNSDFKSQRNKRRRTTSFDNQASRSRSRKKQKVGVFSQNNNGNPEKNIKKPPRHVRRRKELTMNPESGFCTSGDGTKRLRTHVWHAKRFTMTKRWGFHLPLGLHGSGRGSRALLKWLKNGTIVHDASYHSAIQLEGSQDSVLSVLSNIMVPFRSPEAEDVLSGCTYASSMLHHSGAPNSNTIAPVTYMWRPHHQSADADEESGQTNGFRQLWIWIHAASLTEGYNALMTACESQGKMVEGVPSVRCTLLEGQFGTLEVMGSKAFHLIQKILHPVSSMSEKSPVLEKGSLMKADGITPPTNTSILENEEHTPCSGILSLVVSDPRALTKESTEFDSSYTDLWDVGKGLCCPVEESVLCMEKHHERLSSFCLADKSSDSTNLAIKIHSSRICPVILLRRNNLKDSITRWSIILPLSWIKAFWVPLVSMGAQAIGLRERSWVACEAGIPSFPSEFPECSSYASLMQAEAVDVDKEAALRPISVRSSSIPIPPPWNCVRLAFGMNASERESKQVCSSELDSAAELALVDNHMVVARSSGILAGFLSNIYGDRLPLFSEFLDKNSSISKIIRDENILDQGPNMASFLENRHRKLCFVRVILHTVKEGVIEDGAVVCAPRLADINLWTSGSKCRSINKAALQVPQSSMSTYFVKQDSGKWEFLVPEDPAAVESNRWPIGFVTNGFVRGSKKPAAGAVCDAVLLAHLRHEQWSSVPLKRRKKEIYVLTRNLRSAAYRLALASIVLEHQEDLDHI
uniref:ribonucleases P/MRP protein subunit POP1 n=1 Tax=Erigeron canadensis TaxID=72917 RepID=UPI001CB89EF2|nr:ribonucleases P/MRP protein subunit POP1 [Erigeron canadensis]